MTVFVWEWHFQVLCNHVKYSKNCQRLLLSWNKQLWGRVKHYKFSSHIKSSYKIANFSNPDVRYSQFILITQTVFRCALTFSYRSNIIHKDQQLFSLVHNKQQYTMLSIYFQWLATYTFSSLTNHKLQNHLPQFVLSTDNKRTKCHFIQALFLNLLRHIFTSSFVFTVPEFQDSGQWLLCPTQHRRVGHDVQCTMRVAFPSITLFTIITPCNELIM